MRRWGALSMLCFMCASVGLWTIHTVYAATPAEINASIEEHNAQIKLLNQEIALYEKQLKDVSTKKQTLQNTLTQIDLTKKKISVQVSITQNLIRSTQNAIQDLQEGIQKKQTAIQLETAGLAEALRRLQEVETESVAKRMLTEGRISVAWRDADQFQSVNTALKQHIENLLDEKKGLFDAKTAREAKNKELVGQKNNLVEEQGALTATKKAQQELLIATKSQESSYQRILREKQAARDSFEAALNDLKAQFQKTVTAADIPKGGTGVLSWPVDRVRVTQHFGNTAFARSGAYNGKGHNGIDLAVSIGSPIRAARTGTVSGTGNTDVVRGCYSFGKWVLVKHDNGLSTMYAHLSQTSVREGDSVSTGDLLGYSGETGYATGPHLHFGVYVSSATQVVTLGSATKSSTPCANATMPVAPLSAYLDPENYL